MSANIKVVEGDEWQKMYAEIAAASDDTLRATWDVLMNYQAGRDYLPGISPLYVAQAVFNEMDKRKITPDTLLFKKGYSNESDES